jgi:hypothetical protein
LKKPQVIIESKTEAVQEQHIEHIDTEERYDDLEEEEEQRR